MTVLTVRGLGKRFGATVALADLDLDVAQGSRTAVVGPSGSGKTTLLRLIAGFETPDSGEIRLGGQMLANANEGVPAHGRNIGLVMQEGALFPHLSIVENIRFGIRDQRDGHTRALELMDLVELDRTMADRQPHQLSGGQQQRVALARALARRPRLMLLDEPFSALDTGLREQLRQATAQILAEAGVATLLVTHDRDEAMSFADQLVVLREGRLVQAGHPRDLYLAPVDAATAGFLGPAIVVDADITDGMATSVLGTLPVSGPAQASRLPIMVRPEQVRLAQVEANVPGPVWTVRSVLHVGALSRVSLEQADTSNATTLEFETSAVPGLEAGARVTLAIEGRAHCLQRS
jgi:iron(III) transport system ATP-binding protein